MKISSRNIRTRSQEALDIPSELQNRICNNINNKTDNPHLDTVVKRVNF